MKARYGPNQEKLDLMFEMGYTINYGWEGDSVLISKIIRINLFSFKNKDRPIIFMSSISFSPPVDTGNAETVILAAAINRILAEERIPYYGPVIPKKIREIFIKKTI